MHPLLLASLVARFGRSSISVELYGLMSLLSVCLPLFLISFFAGSRGTLLTLTMWTSRAMLMFAVVPVAPGKVLWNNIQWLNGIGCRFKSVPIDYILEAVIRTDVSADMIQNIPIHVACRVGCWQFVSCRLVLLISSQFVCWCVALCRLYQVMEPNSVVALCITCRKLDSSSFSWSLVWSCLLY